MIKKFKLGVLAVLAVISVLAAPASAGSAFSPGTLEAANGAAWGNAPDFTLTTVDGKDFTLSSLKGKVILLNFWATWCPPCRGEIPDFIELAGDYKNSGFEIVGVSLDSSPKKLSKFVKSSGINYPVMLGNKKITAKYGGVRGIPTTFIIDRNGNIANKHVGRVEKTRLEKELLQLIKNREAK